MSTDTYIAVHGRAGRGGVVQGQQAEEDAGRRRRRKRVTETASVHLISGQNKTCGDAWI